MDVIRWKALLIVSMILLMGKERALYAAPTQGFDLAAVTARSLVSVGDTARLQRVLAKARHGENVTVTVIGGSITQGAKATKEENRYGNRVAQWWRETFPQTKVEFVNAGIGATGSNYGALRAQRDLLSHRPDLVITEYAVNDPNDQSAAETLEGLTRQILAQPNHPALLLLFMMNQSGGNAQEWLSKVGTHYELPMISYRDALWPEIQAKRLKWEDISADEVHPNNMGHEYAAKFVTDFLATVLKALPPDEGLPATKVMPPPLFTDLFQHVALFEGEALKPTHNSGWTLDMPSHSWTADEPGSRLEFDVEGQAILLMDWHFRGPLGKARMQIDDRPAIVRDGWFDQTWGGYRATTELARGLAPGKHHVSIEVLEDKNPQSTGHEFRVFGLGVAGVDAASAAAQAVTGQPTQAALSDVDRFNYVLGTQTIGAAYQFTNEPRLVETAQAMLAMGSNVIKFKMGKDYYGKAHENVPEPNPAIHTLTDLARDEPAHKQVLDMPFANYIIWAYPFTGGWWSKGFSKEDQAKEYKEIYDFASYLLKTYNGSGKTFYLGHWEGDWHLRSGYDTKTDDSITPTAIQGMADWLNVRQKAVDDAKRDTPHQNVQVYNYCEVNLVQLAMQRRRTVTNDVLPKTNVDYVSYSSYDSGTNLRPALDYIESKLPPKPGITGKRVFIGEYGFPVENRTPEKQDELSRQVMREGLSWGCPFVLYWEMFNNEVTKDGKQRGFWLIDDKGNKQPIYFTHQRYYQWARQYVADFKQQHSHLPTAAEFSKAAVAYFEK
ncbi:MAG: SGNH/GDSL hydrolase family protein [Abitibacteriaceae bacterium]|nr:SGNH/GDSL hydrolase family protein [Abditibacteriaceae bacterium]